MRKFIIKRLLISIVILFFVGMIAYLLMRCMPADYVEQMARELSSRPGSKSFDEWKNQLYAAYGMDQNLILGYFTWLSNAVVGNFGDAWSRPGQTVIEVFNSVIWYSFALGAISFVLQIVIAIPLGIVAAKKQYSKTDYVVSFIALLGISLPTFFLATLLKWIFSVKLGWLDLFGIVGRNYQQLSSFGKVLDMGAHMILPVITLTVVSIGSLMRYTRTNMLEVLNSDFIRTARAKGLSERRVINYHAFRNTLIPVVTILGGSLPSLFAGAQITETLFQIPGIGYTSYEAILAGDIPFVMFYIVFLAVLTLLGTLIADILYAVVDPRVRIQ
ncbi:MAG TPA: ABC transporter permease [Candidatus Fimimorpha excrementavium]|nr:ABC transporter permease [Candidatus Fimimorpha excrementavium]